MSAAATPPIGSDIAFAMVVGPQEAEMAIDTLDGIASFYPRAALWVREDRTSDGTWEKLNEWSEDKPLVHLSRNPVTQGLDGVAWTVCHLFHQIAESNSAPAVVVKIDPDGIVLRPGLVEAFRQKFAEHGPGMCGSYKFGPDGSRRRLHMHVRTFLYDMLPIGKGHARSFRSKPVYYWKYLIRALRNGYSLGEHVLGGIYALDGRTLIALEKSGFLTAIPLHHKNCARAEDVTIALGTNAAGHALISLNDYPEKVVAWLKAFTPLGITPEEVWDRKYLAVHPVKRKDADIRRFFREKRLAG
jgi:hypothetical protein